MTETVWLLVAFVLLNALDGFTTWLGLYRLPRELRGREANPLLKDAETRFWSAMFRKGVLVLFGLWLFYHFASLYALRVLDLVFIVVVLNNNYIYLSRKISGRRVRGPVELSTALLGGAHVPERVARILGFYVLVGLVIIVCHLIVGAFL